MTTHNNAPLRSLRAAGVFIGRDPSTIMQWVNNGLPHERDGNRYVFNPDDLENWRDTVLSGDTRAGNIDPAYRAQQIRKLRLESDKLKDDARLRERLHRPAHEHEEVTRQLIGAVKASMLETFEQIKDKAGLTPEEIQTIDSELLAGFDRITRHYI